MGVLIKPSVMTVHAAHITSCEERWEREVKKKQCEVSHLPEECPEMSTGGTERKTGP